MLADFIDHNREQLVRSVESRAAGQEPLGLPAARRHERIDALVTEATQALQGKETDGAKRSTAVPGDGAVDSRERELILSELVDLGDRLGSHATLHEMAAVFDWATRAERQVLREENHRLSALLDVVDDPATAFATDGRILYVNQAAARLLHEVTGVPADELIGKTCAELHAPPELGGGLPPDQLESMARSGATAEGYVWERWREQRFGAIYAPDGMLSAVTLVSEDIQNRKLAQTRNQLLSKLAALVGSVHYDNVPEALARVAVPEVADWCIVNVIEDKAIRGTFVAQRDAGKTALRDALLRELPTWSRHPLWQEMLTGGFQLLTEVSDPMLRSLTSNEAQYRLLAQVGARSLMVVPIVSRGQIAGIITLVYTAESGRRYGRHDPALAEELALYTAHIVENARLLKELSSSEARFRVALASARTAVYEQDSSLRYLWYHNALIPFTLVGKKHEDAFPPDQAAHLNEFKQRVLTSGESAQEETDLTLGGARRQYREAVEPVRDHAGKVVGVIGAATDITEEKRAQEELSRALAFRDQINGILGHDLAKSAQRPDDGDRRAAPQAGHARGLAGRKTRRHPARGRTDDGDDRHAARLHAHPGPGEAPRLACSARPGHGRPGRDRRVSQRVPGPHHRRRRARRPARRVGPRAHRAGAVESGRQRDRLRRPSHAGACVRRRRRPGRPREGEQRGSAHPARPDPGLLRALPARGE